MRKITKESVNAFLMGKTFNKGNMSVVKDGETFKLRLHV